jgi:hypothetical protein
VYGLDLTPGAGFGPLTQFGIGGPGRRLAVDGARLLVAAEKDGLWVVDLTDLTNPGSVTTVAASSAAMDVAPCGRAVCVADYLSRLALLDGRTLSVISVLETPGAAVGLAVHKDKVMVADYSGGIRPARLAEGLREDGSPWVTLGWVSGVAAGGNRAAAIGTNGLALLDLAMLSEMPAIRYLIDASPGETFAGTDVALVDRRAYLLQTDVGFRVFEVDDDLSEMGRYTLTRPRAMVVKEDLAFVVHPDGLAILRVEQMPPMLLQSFTHAWDAVDVLAWEDALYVADRSGTVWTLNVGDPSRPILTGQWDRPALRLAMGGNLLVAAAGDKGLCTAVLGDLFRPLKLGRWIAEDARDVAVIGSRAYLADACNGLHVILLKSPAGPTSVGVLSTAGSPQAVAIDEEWVVVADAAGGLLVYRREQNRDCSA